MNCFFCDKPDFTSGWLRPPMCEAHLELALIRGRFQRAGLYFSLRNVQQEYQLKARDGYRWSFGIDQIPELMNEMAPEDYRPVIAEAKAVPA